MANKNPHLIPSENESPPSSVLISEYPPCESYIVPQSSTVKPSNYVTNTKHFKKKIYLNINIIFNCELTIKTLTTLSDADKHMANISVGPSRRCQRSVPFCLDLQVGVAGRRVTPSKTTRNFFIFVVAT